MEEVGFKEKVLNAHQEVQTLLKQLSQHDFKEIQDKISLLESSINDIVQTRVETDTKIKELEPLKTVEAIEDLKDRIFNKSSEKLSNPTSPTKERSAVESPSVAESVELMDYDTLIKRKADPGLDFKKLESYLTNSEFERVFKMTKTEFYKLPNWQMERRKKQVALF